MTPLSDLKPSKAYSPSHNYMSQSFFMINQKIIRRKFPFQHIKILTIIIPVTCVKIST